MQSNRINMAQVMEQLELKFKSGNDIPVSRAVITREKYEAIKAFSDDFLTIAAEITQ